MKYCNGNKLDKGKFDSKDRTAHGWFFFVGVFLDSGLHRGFNVVGRFHQNEMKVKLGFATHFFT